MRFVTGCYICGTQVNPKLRIQHEKECIVEWRSRNNMLSADKRKPEPRRPDYRFTRKEFFKLTNSIAVLVLRAQVRDNHFSPTLSICRLIPLQTLETLLNLNS